jgi:hypothetical protein
VPSHSADPLRRGALGKCLTSLPSACGKIIPQSVNAHATLGQKSVPVGHLLAPLGQKSAPLGQNLPHWGGHSPHWGGRLGPLGAPRRPTGARPEVPLWQTPCPTVPDFLAQWALLGLLCPLGLVCQTLLWHTGTDRTTTDTVSGSVSGSYAVQTRSGCVTVP